MAAAARGFPLPALQCYPPKMFTLYYYIDSFSSLPKSNEWATFLLLNLETLFSHVGAIPYLLPPKLARTRCAAAAVKGETHVPPPPPPSDVDSARRRWSEFQFPPGFPFSGGSAFRVRTLSTEGERERGGRSQDNAGRPA